MLIIKNMPHTYLECMLLLEAIEVDKDSISSLIPEGLTSYFHLLAKRFQVQKQLITFHYSFNLSALLIA